VKDIPKLREAGGRLPFLSPVGEDALHAALPIERLPLVALAVNTGLRWSEQARLRWLDVDLLTGFLTVATRLDGVTWHALRHTFASRLVAAGVDLRTVQELGGWRTLSMVQRYAHLSPGHLVAAVEKIVAVYAVVVPGAVSVPELRRNFDSAETAPRELEVRH
jgi:integrase